MPFVKLDCGILTSTIWSDTDARDVFLTALLMAEPRELAAAADQIEVRSLKLTGWSVPPGWYGMVPAAGSGIVRTSGIPLKRGLDALERMGAPDAESRSHDYAGRRLVRVDGGYIVLNFIKYRERDYTASERQRRFRQRRRHAVTDDHNGVTSRHVTQAEAEVETEAEINTDTSRGVSEASSRALVLADRADAKAISHDVVEYLAAADCAAHDRVQREQLERAVAAMAFSYWVKKGPHPGAIFDEEREKKARARCRERRGDPIVAVASEMLYVVQGALVDDYVMGRDPKARGRHDRFELLFKNRSNVEHFAGLCPDHVAGRLHPLAMKYLGNGDGPPAA